jgi:hypothetical protein
MTDTLPTSLTLGKWCSDESELPSEPTDELFLIVSEDVETKDRKFSIASFHYDRGMRKPDFDEWRTARGGSAFARLSEDNYWNVIKWAKIEGIM